MSFLKKRMIYVVIYLGLIGIFLGLLLLSASLPRTKKFNSWMLRSSRLLSKGGEYPEINRITLDNATDALILNASCSFQPDAPMNSVIRIYHHREGIGMTGSWSLFMNGKDVKPPKGQYGRYWFGQSAVMKFLHYFWDLSRIYTFIGSLALFLLIVSSFLAYQKTGCWYAAGSLFIIAALANFQVLFQSLQFPPVFLIGFIGLICFLLFDDPAWRLPGFFASGMITAYFDLLTAPVLAFGIPALIICGKDTVQLARPEKNGWKDWLRIWCGYPAAWLAGYVLSWGTKIILFGFVTGDFQSIVDEIFLRTSTVSGQGRCSRWDAVAMNFQCLFDCTQMVFGLVCIAVVLLLIWHLIQWKRHKETLNLQLVAGYFFLAVMPLAVFLLMTNHTYIHRWMTYRGLALTFASLLMLMTAFRPAAEEKKPS